MVLKLFPPQSGLSKGWSVLRGTVYCTMGSFIGAVIVYRVQGGGGGGKN